MVTMFPVAAPHLVHVMKEKEAAVVIVTALEVCFVHKIVAKYLITMHLLNWIAV